MLTLLQNLPYHFYVYPAFKWHETLSKLQKMLSEKGPMAKEDEVEATQGCPFRIRVKMAGLIG